MLFAMRNFMMVAVAENTMLAASVCILSKPAHLSKPTSLSFARRSPGTANPLCLNRQSFFFRPLKLCSKLAQGGQPTVCLSPSLKEP